MPIVHAYEPAASDTPVLSQITVQVNPLFPRHAEDLKDGQSVAINSLLRFDTGSTEAYTEWRERLAEMVGLEETAVAHYGVVTKSRAVTALDKPAPAFQELLAFSNTDGVIGPQTCLRLYKDFCDYHEKARAFFGEDVQALCFYESLLEVFEFAVEAEGFVQLSHPVKRTGQRRPTYAPHELPAYN